MVRPLLLVDAPYMLYRAFHGLPKSIKGADGKPVNAILGATNSVLAVAAEHDARAVVMCTGPDSAAYRTELYAGYHAERPPVPRELRPQWDRAPDLWRALGWRVEASTELEADDLLGGFARVEADAGGRALILTGDRDMFQCVGDAVSVVLLGGKQGPQVMDAAAVEGRYGIPPALVPDFIALRGDPSDGIPGARGIGEKTAADLLRRHGSLEAVLAAAAPGTGLAGAREELLAFKDIATLRPPKLKRPKDADTDRAGGAAVAREIGMKRLAERLEG
jgi:DNA polymerase-1